MAELPCVSQILQIRQHKFLSSFVQYKMYHNVFFLNKQRENVYL